MPNTFSPLEAMGVKLPYSIEAEQAVIGAIIINNDAYHDVVEIVEPGHFYSRQNAQIYSLIVLMMTENQRPDFVSLLTRVEDAEIFETKQAAKQYLFEVTQTVPSVSNVAAYAKIVYDKYLVRSLLEASGEIIENVSDSDSTAEELLEFAEQRIDDIRRGRDYASLVPYPDVIDEFLEHLSNITGEDKAKYRGLMTGYTYLDNILNGLKRSNLIVLAARPGVGKTTFALNIASNIIKEYNVPVAIFSLEMSRRQLAERVISGATGISANLFQSGNIKQEELNGVFNAVLEYKDQMMKSQLYIDESPGITVSQIKAKARKLKGLGLIIVDYLQLMRSGKKAENRVNEVSEITRQFKILAKELDVPILLLSQLSRASEKDKNRAPILSDLRDSGSIEQDADIVMFIHREKDDNNALKNDTLMMVAKNRYGRQAVARFVFDADHTRFNSAAASGMDEPDDA